MYVELGALNSPHVPLNWCQSWCHCGQVLLPYQGWKACGRTDLVSLARMLFNNLVIMLDKWVHEAYLKIPLLISSAACFSPALRAGS